MRKKTPASSPQPATWPETVRSYEKLAPEKADGFVNSIYSATAARWKSFKSAVSFELPAKGKCRKKRRTGAHREPKGKGAPAASSPSLTFSEIFSTFSERGRTKAKELKAVATEYSKQSFAHVGAALGRDVHEHTAAGLTIALLLSLVLVVGNIYKRRVSAVRVRTDAVSRTITDCAVGGGSSADPLSTVAAAPAESEIETKTDSKIDVSGAGPDARDAAPEPSKLTSSPESLALSRENSTFEAAQEPTSVSAAETEAREPATPEVPMCAPAAAPAAATQATEVASNVVGAAAVAAVSDHVGAGTTEPASPAPEEPAVKEEEGYVSVGPTGEAAKVDWTIVDAGNASNAVKDRAEYTEDAAAVVSVNEEAVQAAPPPVDAAMAIEALSNRTPKAGENIVQERLEETAVTEKAAVAISAVVSADEDALSTTTSVTVSEVPSMTASSAAKPHAENERAPMADGGLPAAEPSGGVEAAKVDDAISPKGGYDSSLCEQANVTTGTILCDTEAVKDEVVEEATEAVGGALANDGPSDATVSSVSETLLSEVTGVAVPTEMPVREEGGFVVITDTTSQAVTSVVVEQTREESGEDAVVSKNVGPVTFVSKADGVDNRAAQKQGGMDVSSALGLAGEAAAAAIAIDKPLDVSGVTEVSSVMEKSSPNILVPAMDPVASARVATTKESSKVEATVEETPVMPAAATKETAEPALLVGDSSGATSETRETVTAGEVKVKVEERAEDQAATEVIPMQPEAAAKEAAEPALLEGNSSGTVSETTATTAAGEVKVKVEERAEDQAATEVIPMQPEAAAKEAAEPALLEGNSPGTVSETTATATAVKVKVEERAEDQAATEVIPMQPEAAAKEAAEPALLEGNSSGTVSETTATTAAGEVKVKVEERAEDQAATEAIPMQPAAAAKEAGEPAMLEGDTGEASPRATAMDAAGQLKMRVEDGVESQTAKESISMQPMVEVIEAAEPALIVENSGEVSMETTGTTVATEEVKVKEQPEVKETTEAIAKNPAAAVKASVEQAAFVKDSGAVASGTALPDVVAEVEMKPELEVKADIEPEIQQATEVIPGQHTAAAEEKAEEPMEFVQDSGEAAPGTTATVEVKAEMGVEKKPEAKPIKKSIPAKLEAVAQKTNETSLGGAAAAAEAEVKSKVEVKAEVEPKGEADTEAISTHPEAAAIKEASKPEALLGGSSGAAPEITVPAAAEPHVMPEVEVKVEPTTDAISTLSTVATEETAQPAVVVWDSSGVAPEAKSNAAETTVESKVGLNVKPEVENAAEAIVKEAAAVVKEASALGEDSGAMKPGSMVALVAEPGVEADAKANAAQAAAATKDGFNPVVVVQEDSSRDAPSDTAAETEAELGVKVKVELEDREARETAPMQPAVVVKEATELAKPVADDVAAASGAIAMAIAKAEAAEADAEAFLDSIADEPEPEMELELEGQTVTEVVSMQPAAAIEPAKPVADAVAAASGAIAMATAKAEAAGAEGEEFLASIADEPEMEMKTELEDQEARKAPSMKHAVAVETAADPMKPVADDVAAAPRTRAEAISKLEATGATTRTFSASAAHELKPEMGLKVEIEDREAREAVSMQPAAVVEEAAEPTKPVAGDVAAAPRTRAEAISKLEATGDSTRTFSASAAHELKPDMEDWEARETAPMQPAVVVKEATDLAKPVADDAAAASGAIAIAIAKAEAAEADAEAFLDSIADEPEMELELEGQTATEVVSMQPAAAIEPAKPVAGAVAAASGAIAMATAKAEAAGAEAEAFLASVADEPEMEMKTELEDQEARKAPSMKHAAAVETAADPMKPVADDVAAAPRTRAEAISKLEATGATTRTFSASAAHELKPEMRLKVEKEDREAREAVSMQPAAVVEEAAEPTKPVAGDVTAAIAKAEAAEADAEAFLESVVDELDPEMELEGQTTTEAVSMQPAAAIEKAAESAKPVTDEVAAAPGAIAIEITKAEAAGAEVKTFLASVADEPKPEVEMKRELEAQAREGASMQPTAVVELAANPAKPIADDVTAAPRTRAEAISRLKTTGDSTWTLSASAERKLKPEMEDRDRKVVSMQPAAAVEKATNPAKPVADDVVAASGAIAMAIAKAETAGAEAEAFLASVADEPKPEVEMKRELEAQAREGASMQPAAVVESAANPAKPIADDVTAAPRTRAEAISKLEATGATTRTFSASAAHELKPEMGLKVEIEDREAREAVSMQPAAVVEEAAEPTKPVAGDVATAIAKAEAAEADAEAFLESVVDELDPEMELEGQTTTEAVSMQPAAAIEKAAESAKPVTDEVAAAPGAIAIEITKAEAAGAEVKTFLASVADEPKPEVEMKRELEAQAREGASMQPTAVVELAANPAKPIADDVTAAPRTRAEAISRLKTTGDSTWTLSASAERKLKPEMEDRDRKVVSMQPAAAVEKATNPAKPVADDVVAASGAIAMAIAKAETAGAEAEAFLASVADEPKPEVEMKHELEAQAREGASMQPAAVVESAANPAKPIADDVTAAPRTRAEAISRLKTTGDSTWTLSASAAHKLKPEMEDRDRKVVSMQPTVAAEKAANPAKPVADDVVASSGAIAMAIAKAETAEAEAKAFLESVADEAEPEMTEMESSGSGGTPSNKQGLGSSFFRRRRNKSVPNQDPEGDKEVPPTNKKGLKKFMNLKGLRRKSGGKPT